MFRRFTFSFLVALLFVAVASVAFAAEGTPAIAAGLEGIARNPSAQNKIFIPMIVGLALIESLVIYALVIAFVLVGKL
jgi:F-type H+-transporting ATPase subunit c